LLVNEPEQNEAHAIL